MNQVLADLDQAMHTLEDLYIEGEGEVTEETERLEAQISGLQELLTKEGIDLLGAWLKSKEDRKKALKAEKDYISRQILANDATIEFIKDKITEVMKATGQEKIKGERGYSFTASHSVKTEVDKDVLKKNYEDKVENAIRAAGVPAYVCVSLTASSTRANELGVLEGDEEIFSTTEKDTVTFRNPRQARNNGTVDQGHMDSH